MSFVIGNPTVSVRRGKFCLPDMVCQANETNMCSPLSAEVVFSIPHLSRSGCVYCVKFHLSTNGIITSVVTCLVKVNFFTCCTMKVFIPSCFITLNGPSYLTSNLFLLLMLLISTKSLIFSNGSCLFKSYRVLYCC